IDPTEGYVAYARDHILDSRASFVIGDAQDIPADSKSYDVVVSALAVNFIPDKAKAAAEMARVVRSGGVVAAYVWDYADQMQLLRYFWDSAIALNPAASEQDEGRRFPICKPEPMIRFLEGAGLRHVEARSIEI